VNDDPTALLKKHSKSFNFARLFLGSETGLAAARLYRLCRIVDDIADDSPEPKIAFEQLNFFKTAIVQNTASHPVIEDFLRLCDEYQIDRNHGITLIDGVSQDLNSVALSGQDSLIQYAFRVAGVVGLMMAPILGASKAGYPFAIDLGIGMQLTNIARDVQEDAQMARRYLPGDLVDDLTAQQIASGLNHRPKVQQAIKAILTLAEEYYQSGLAGLYFLPPRNRRAIAVAAYVYREIGRKLMRNNCAYWQGRVAISKPRKISLACQALWHLKTGAIAKQKTQHKQTLHLYLPDKLYTK
jgi:phytoene synthase